MLVEIIALSLWSLYASGMVLLCGPARRAYTKGKRPKTGAFAPVWRVIALLPTPREAFNYGLLGVLGAR